MLLLMKPSQKRHRPSRGHWPKLEKALVQAFAGRYTEGETVRRKWFERTAKALFLQIYPGSSTIFVVSSGWFNRFLSRNQISIRVVMNKAQQIPIEYCAMIVSFLCFNWRNSQLRDGMEETVLRSVIAVGCYLLSNILNMDQTPLPWEYLEGKTYEFKGSKTVWVCTWRSGWDKQQATIQLTIFADGIDRVMPLIIFRSTENNTSAPRRREEKLFDSRVVVKFNPKGYANSAIMVFWLEFMPLSVLGTSATLLVMDLFKSHSTQEIKDWLRTHRIDPSLVPSSCTGLVQPLDISVNCPFKDILKQVIDDAVDLSERQTTPATGKKDWQLAASKMRVMMTKWVGDAWKIFNWKNRDVVIRSFRCLGIALPIDGSCDNEISIKGLETTMLMEGLKNWEHTPTIDSSSEGTSDNPETDASDEEDEPTTK